MSSNFVAKATHNPIMLSAIIIACCLPLHCEGDVSFENAIAKKDGSIELDLLLNARAAEREEGVQRRQR